MNLGPAWRRSASRATRDASAGSVDLSAAASIRTTVRSPSSVKTIRSAISIACACSASSSPRAVLDRSFLAERERADVSALDLDRDVERGGKAGAEPLVLVGVRAAQLMIQVRRARDDEDAVSLQLAREVQERDGIGAAGQGD